MYNKLNMHKFANILSYWWSKKKIFLWMWWYFSSFKSKENYTVQIFISKKEWIKNDQKTCSIKKLSQKLFILKVPSRFRIHYYQFQPALYIFSTLHTAEAKKHTLTRRNHNTILQTHFSFHLNYVFFCQLLNFFFAIFLSPSQTVARKTLLHLSVSWSF